MFDSSLTVAERVYQKVNKLIRINEKLNEQFQNLEVQLADSETEKELLLERNQELEHQLSALKALKSTEEEAESALQLKSTLNQAIKEIDNIIINLGGKV